MGSEGLTKTVLTDGEVTVTHVTYKKSNSETNVVLQDHYKEKKTPGKEGTEGVGV